MLWKDLEPKLEPGQPAYEFAACDERRIRVIAGPGAGKSFAMKRRIIRLLEEGVDPKQILPVTFTHLAKEALENDLREIKDEIEKKLNDGVIVSADKKSAEKIINGVKKIKATTLHSLCLRILRQAEPGKKVRTIQDFELEPIVSDLRVIMDRPEADLPTDIDSWLEFYGGMRVGDWIKKAVECLNKCRKNHPDRWTFQQILVDEYQDLNAMDQKLISMLVAEGGTLTVIGDDDQSIYSFRSANPLGLEQFKDQDLSCADFSFEECYRCPQSVVRNATELIQHNSNRFPKNLKPLTIEVAKACSSTTSEDELKYNTVGSTEVYHWPTQEEEIDGLSRIIAEEINKEDSHLKGGDVIVLSQDRESRKQIQAALKNLKKSTISTVSCVRDEIFDSPAARESFSWLCLLANEKDLISWRYLLGCESTGFFSKSFFHLLSYQQMERIDMLEALERCCGKENPTGQGSVKSNIVRRYLKLKTKLQDMRDKLESDKNDSNKVLNILCNPSDPASADYCDVLKQAIVENSKKHEQHNWLTLIRNSFLRRAFHPEPSEKKGKIRVMSMHAAKGLSARLVVIADAIDDYEDEDIEEQRRLFYVAITRCKAAKLKDGQTDENVEGYPGKVIVSSYKTLKNGKRIEQSRFIDEMGKENVTFNNM